MSLPIFQIENSPDNVVKLMSCGAFFSHFDGRWRYYPHGGAVHYASADPTEHFTHRATFGARCVVADPERRLYANIHPDGTRGLRMWERDHELALGVIYAPRDSDERAARAWLLEVMP